MKPMEGRGEGEGEEAPRESPARLQNKDEMLGCDDVSSSKNRRKGRRLPGDTWYPGSAPHEQIESVPTLSHGEY